MMEDTEETKQQAIAELNRMVEEWPPYYCQHLLQEAQRMDKAATAPPLMKDKDGEVFWDHLRIHARHEERGSLCGCEEQCVPIEEFEQIPDSRKCGSCERSLRKLQGEEIIAGNDFWLHDSQRDLLFTIYRLGGSKCGPWCSFKDLQGQSNYSAPEALRRALQRLERRGVVERKIEGKRGYVRLVGDIVRENHKGYLFVHIGPEIEE